mmetsp:Transcript_5030/g.7403  ORF Transcript_5030/g.7403 Transcript_5030/m.7403 type:complete len:126 (-) Transcript_5030:18-395(-)|eukprot:CAMPEP_0203639674 /NCGR_PEP_ID=MMETSP0088-20131115/5378_1 /ASSEMBLY_ACC=CAM_ASM_001087 /TAXON_ID=426623 /ORGANISM="Chaetoceros affinis, Strain CCMP159" /LENGTH=125 /DNA_ID=CAMNT_0050494635 /DNA_START=213 /DNA_END=590 /DNA_ORIENTATION=+
MGCIQSSDAFAQDRHRYKKNMTGQRRKTTTRSKKTRPTHYTSNDGRYSYTHYTSSGGAYVSDSDGGTYNSDTGNLAAADYIIVGSGGYSGIDFGCGVSGGGDGSGFSSSCGGGGFDSGCDSGGGD